MAVQLLSKSDSAIYVGESSDTKPTAPTLLSKFFEMDTKAWYFWDGTSWELDDGPPVSNAGSVSGDAATCALVADTAAPGANDVLSSATGFKGFEALLAGALGAIGTGDVALEMVAVAWSTLEADDAGVAALLALAVAEFDGTPTVPPVLINNVRILRTIDDIVGASWDGVTTIKTIGVRGVGTTPGQVDVVINVIA